MPELPDITLYVERLRAKVQGHTLDKLRIASPFLLRSVTPPVSAIVGQPILAIDRIGKRLLFSFPNELFAVIHLMIAGRLRWREPGAKLPGQMGLAALDFAPGTVIFTEASKKKRASLHLVEGRLGLAAFDRGGLDVMRASPAEFAARLRAERHTVKRSLTDPTIFDGIGNAYSDEILHAAKMSPFRITTSIDDADAAKLQEACVRVLNQAIEVLRAEVGDGFPETVTAFRPEMAVHGKYGQPCPVCGQKVCRIVYAENEANYCATCQTEGRLLADRSLSRLLKDDWPKTLEELEERRAQRIAPSPSAASPAASPSAAPSPSPAPAAPGEAAAPSSAQGAKRAAPRKKPKAGAAPSALPTSTPAPSEPPGEPSSAAPTPRAKASPRRKTSPS